MQADLITTQIYVYVYTMCISNKSLDVQQGYQDNVHVNIISLINVHVHVFVVNHIGNFIKLGK